jgi:hypothetical protein
VALLAQAVRKGLEAEHQVVYQASVLIGKAQKHRTAWRFRQAS